MYQEEGDGGIIDLTLTEMTAGCYSTEEQEQQSTTATTAAALIDPVETEEKPSLLQEEGGTATTPPKPRPTRSVSAQRARRASTYKAQNISPAKPKPTQRSTATTTAVDTPSGVKVRSELAAVRALHGDDPSAGSTTPHTPTPTTTTTPNTSSSAQSNALARSRERRKERQSISPAALLSLIHI